MDFVAALRIVEIAGRGNAGSETETLDAKPDKPLRIVVYMGGAHVESLKEFFTSSQAMNGKPLKVIESVGKSSWEDDEPKVLKLGAQFWRGSTSRE